MQALAFATARTLNALYFVASFAYCLLSYSEFAYEQFIRPQLLGWLPDLVARHHELFWLTLLVTCPTLIPALRHGATRARAAAATYLALNVALGLWLVVNPVLALVGPGTRTLVVAILCLVPLLALAVVDHLTVTPPTPRSIDERRLFLGAFTAAVATWLTYVVLIPLSRPSGVDIPLAGIALAVVISLVSHLLVFALVYMLVVAGLSLATIARHPRAEYWILAALWVAALAFVLHRIVAAALSFRAPESWVLSGWLGLVLVAVWSGLSWQNATEASSRTGYVGAKSRSGTHVGAASRSATHVSAERGEEDAIDLWFAPIVASLRGLVVAGLFTLPVMAFALRAGVAHFDWNFLFQKLGVCLVWALALGWAHAAARPRSGVLGVAGAPTYGLVAAAMVVSGLAGVPVATRLAAWSGDARLAPEFVLDRYTAYDPSYHLIRDLLRRNSGEAAAFYTYLKAHSTLGSVAADPVDVRFVEQFEVREPLPHVFLFVVDSLRRDYLSPYNPAVTFTPATEAFAREGVVFERAFSRYGATGLSVPALWAGGLLLHKQYVKPFAPMNALEKLLEGAGYRRFISDDHLVMQLFRPSPATTLLDESIQEMDHTLCATLQELESRLDESAADPRPIFAMTRPLQLHMARLVRDPATDAATYPGFSAGYAAQVAALDRCLGEFVGYLKRTALYDKSVVVLTSDHGESLGEDGRWGHAYTLYPEVVQIPLIIHVPRASPLAADRSRLALSTDITPTLYALAGQRTRDLGSLYGQALFWPADHPVASRRRESFLLSSSYGPVYAMLRHNGRALYIADAVQGRDFAYEMRPDGKMVPLTVTDSMRAVNQQLIRDQIGRIATEYRFSPAP